MGLSLKEFEQRYKDIMEFYYIDSPHDCPEEPDKYYVSKGFQPPYKSWLTFGSWRSNSSDDPEEQKAPNVVTGIDVSAQVVFKEMEANGPFDGVIGFSQGNIFFRHFYRLTMAIDPENLKPPCEMPKFIISFAGPVFRHMQIGYKDKMYSQEGFSFPLESIHIYGKKDIFRESMIESQFYLKPVIVDHEEGHKIPKDFSEEHQQMINEFIRKQYINKFGDDVGFKVNDLSTKL
ncbi:UNKNOWN [Stylonychia lemnae]|uniref:Serine hydrolase domain-containing protein n=1 Tax=Stylonychia lemnae TaxID=5949 RepID=A0A077ZPB2_STYLE|nr:UNKNOWN [Stylonychia lemnae]|eukprot:CDW71753.1 UNKNOWN [Stylonychia lemnae]